MSDLIETGGSLSGRERNCCYLNLGGPGRFADVSYASGLDFPDDARAVAAVDWDHDGDLDLWVTNRTAPRLRFLRNNGTPGHAGLAVRLQGARGNRDAIGARLELRGAGKSDGSIYRSVQAGTGYLAQSSKWVHFGTAGETAARDLVVHWPGGAVETIPGLQPGGRYRVVEGTGQAVRQPERRVTLAGGALKSLPATQRARIALIEHLPLTGLHYQDHSDRDQLVQSRGPLLVNLWATWCLPCVSELKEFSERSNDLQRAGLDVLALSVDGLKDRTLIPAGPIVSFLKKHEVKFPAGRVTAETVDRLDVLHDTLLSTRTRLDEKLTLPVPSSFLLDADGRLAVIYKGPVSVETLLADAARLEQAPDNATVYPGRWFLRPHGLGGVVLRVADRMVRRGHLDDALSYARLAADLVGRNGNPFGLRHRVAGALVDLGNAWDERKQAGRSEEAYQLAYQLEPLNPTALTNLGNLRYRRGDLRAAEQFYRDALAQDPDQLQAHVNLGNIHLQQRRLPAAIEHFRNAVRIGPRFPPAHFLLGLALLRQGQRETARNHFQEALRLDPNYGDARSKLEALGGTVRGGGGS